MLWTAHKMKQIILLFPLLPMLVVANPLNDESEIKTAQIQIPQKHLATLSQNTPKLTYSLQEIQQNEPFARYFLSQAIYQKNSEQIEQLVAIYQQFPKRDEILEKYAYGKLAMLQENYGKAIEFYQQILVGNSQLNTVRIELAMAYFYDQKNKQARQQFNQALQADSLPLEISTLIQSYLSALEKRDKWQISANANYIKNRNVNNASTADEIEKTGYIKNSDMKPQKATGFAYNLDFSRDWNIAGSHYLAFANEFYGKLYWDNRDYDDMNNRISFGYAYKNANSTLRLLPFYEKRWYGGSSYQWKNGLRAEFNHWFSPKWQNSTALEYAKLRYFSSMKNEINQLASNTLVWLPNNTNLLSLGLDFNREKSEIKQYSSDTYSVRFGWRKIWQAEIGTQLSLGYSRRSYKDVAKLGGFLDLKKKRQDNIYHASFTFWKNNWHWLGITPKLQFSWKKYDSNLPTLYSYSDKNVNLILERRF